MANETYKWKRKRNSTKYDIMLCEYIQFNPEKKNQTVEPDYY